MSFLNLQRELGEILEKAASTMTAEEIHGAVATMQVKTSLMLMETTKLNVYDAEDRNARLFAAAPDMLAALQAIKEGVQFWDTYPLDHCYGRARAAIAKATGGTV